MKTLQQILANYRQIAFSERDKGNRFERLMQAFLRTERLYESLFEHVWLWNEFPGRAEFGGSDTGIDLVAKTYYGQYWAIQCKFYQEGTTIGKPEVDTFLSTSSRQFRNETGERVSFAQRLWIDTTGKAWGSNAEEAIKNQQPPFTRLNLADLSAANVDWEKLENGVHGKIARNPGKKLREHQEQAIENAHAYYQTAERGKLIMACGTGKTFTSLRLAEKETNGKGLILFLVPSIALLGQTLREWSSDAEEAINAICICSDPEVSRKRAKNEDADTFSVVDLALPASTNTSYILQQFRQLQQAARPGMTVVFSTYQSIEVIARAQQELLAHGFPPFDLIICDEAHRTTGVTLSGEDESAFTKVHDNTFLQARKRLYMTATPRLFSDDSKSKAALHEAVLCSMDDEELYGQEFYRIGFGEAVERNLLTDYKVLILTMSDKDVPAAVQSALAGESSEIKTDDLSKIIGSINALSKQFIGDEGATLTEDATLMRRAVAFCPSIASSKQITQTYNASAAAYRETLPDDRKEKTVLVASRHIDGGMNAPQRDELVSWLKAPVEGNECRILTNVRCLSEGVDVPSLDAVLFLSARNSQVDVVQSVGRVMRLAKDKKYGYIIIPVVVPSDVAPEKALDDNDRFRVVWTVLNALRAHDDRFNAVVNKIELNKKRPAQIVVGSPAYSHDPDERDPAGSSGHGDGDGGYEAHEPQAAYETANRVLNRQLMLQFEQLQHVIFARLVQKVGDRRYWEQWAKDVAQIAERQTERIQYLIAERPDQRAAFERFLTGLQTNINPGITAAQAVEMLAQHIITQPIFEALFDGYSFVKHNAVSTAMQHMMDVLETGSNLTADSETLQRFYESVKKRAAGIDNAEGKQRIIIELYDKFFKTAFPKMVEQLGIVYTPVEVVDFIIHSVNDVLKQEFGRSLSDENVHILDPFTGTGTFMTRLLQSGLIAPKDLSRKYHHELHANEIVLLAYYIAAINIENAYHDQLPRSLRPLEGNGIDGGDFENLSHPNSTRSLRPLEGNGYEPFDGIVLTDTFQLGETDSSERLFSDTFPQNSERVTRQKNAPLRVIIGNPPYSVGQKSANDNAQNQKYERLDKRIEETYAKGSTATSVKALYDAYIKAFRWSTDRLDPEHGGVIAFVSNGAWLDANGMDGFRKMLEKEFSSIYVFNLRGNARTQGELRQKEAGNVFGSGSRTPIAITFLVKKPGTTHKAAVHYLDIGDYLNRDEKLARISELRSLAGVPWTPLQPNEHGDWISLRQDEFGTFIPAAPEKKFDLKSHSYFVVNSLGINTNRDAWVYNSGRKILINNVTKMVNFYNSELIRFKIASEKDNKIRVEDFISTDATQISWSSSLIPKLEKYEKAILEEDRVNIAVYRPFYKQFIYRGDKMIHRRGQFEEFFPSPAVKNLVICVSANYKDGSVLIADQIPDLHFNGDTQAFPLYYYEEAPAAAAPTLFGSGGTGGSDYVRRDGVSDYILQRAQKQYGTKNITKEDIFYYVYGFLHSPDYRTAFANDLKKMLPRLPLVGDVRDFRAFSKAGRALADLHLHYESVPPCPGVTVTGAESEFYTVEKMRFPKKGQTDTIHYNSQITVSDIPARAYDYVVNGKSAIEWIMERYAVTVHKESGIRNDPNDWATEVGNPRYILDLLLSIIHVSVQTVAIVEGLPRLDFRAGAEPSVPEPVEGAETEAICENDVVYAVKALPGVPAGTRGTVVFVYDDERTTFEVEFFAATDPVVLTVGAGEIRKKEGQ